MARQYILNPDHTTRPCDDLLEWARWFETADLHVADDTIRDSRVSTVFLGLDHGDGRHAPMLFETMVFGGKLDGQRVRYATWQAAESGHADILESVRESEQEKQGEPKWPTTTPPTSS